MFGGRSEVDWKTLESLMKGNPVWKRWEKLETGKPPDDKRAKQITVSSYLKYINKLRRVRDEMPWNSTVVISPLSLRDRSGFPLVTIKKPSDCDKEIKDIEKFLLALYDAIDQRLRKVISSRRLL